MLYPVFSTGYFQPGGSTVIYGLYRYVPLWRVWFSSSLLQDRVYKSERLGLEQGIIFQETDQLVEDFIQTRDCGIRFCFGSTTVLVTSVVSGKQLLQDRADLGSLLYIGQQNSAELALVQVKGSVVPAAHPRQKFLIFAQLSFRSCRTLLFCCR